MFGLGTGELLIVAALALILLGPERLPQIATSVGKFLGKLRLEVDEIKQEIKKDFPKDFKDD